MQEQILSLALVSVKSRVRHCHDSAMLGNEGGYDVE